MRGADRSDACVAVRFGGALFMPLLAGGERTGGRGEEPIRLRCLEV